MRRTGNCWSVLAIGMKVAATVNGVFGPDAAVPLVAQPAKAPTPSAAADCSATRRAESCLFDDTFPPFLFNYPTRRSPVRCVARRGEVAINTTPAAASARAV